MSNRYYFKTLSLLLFITIFSFFERALSGEPPCQNYIIVWGPKTQAWYDRVTRYSKFLNPTDEEKFNKHTGGCFLSNGRSCHLKRAIPEKEFIDLINYSTKNKSFKDINIWMEKCHETNELINQKKASIASEKSELLNIKDNSDNPPQIEARGITISYDDMKKIYKKGAIIQSFVSYQISSMDVGKSMSLAPQTWTFPNVPFVKADYSYISDPPNISGLPNISYTLLKKSIYDSALLYRFYNYENDTLYMTGDCYLSKDSSKLYKYRKGYIGYPFKFGNNKWIESIDTNYLDASKKNYTITYHYEFVNGYGTIISPLGTFEALKIAYQTVISTYENSIENASKESVEAGYCWYTREGHRFKAEAVMSEWVWPPQGRLNFGKFSYEMIDYIKSPVADFSATVNNIATGASVSFIDNSTGYPSSWSWSFPGGNPSTSAKQNPSGIIYNTPGKYPVSLTVKNESGTNSITKTGYITVTGGQAIKIDMNSKQFPYGIMWIVSDKNNNTLYQYGPYYDFTNNRKSDTLNLPKGIYNFTIFDPFGNDTTGLNSYSLSNLNTGETYKTGSEINFEESTPFYIGLIADFKISTTTILKGTSVTYNDDSKNSPASRQWIFPGGNPSTSIEKNPVITYSIAGIYDVTLIVKKGNETDTIKKINYITVQNPAVPNSVFSVSSNMICQGQTVDFNDQSKYFPTAWEWTFEGGEPASSNVQNPKGIKYNNPGAYPISLKVNNSLGSQTKLIKGFVSVKPAKKVTLTLKTDDYGSDIFWYVYEGFGLESVLYSSPVYKDVVDGETFTYDFYLPQGTFYFDILDASGDGLIGNYGSGYYKLTDAETGQVIAQGGEFEDIDEAEIIINMPLAAYLAAEKTNIAPGDSVGFIDISAGEAGSWLWTFPGGTPGTSTEQNPLVTYKTAGVYDVTLQVKNTSGSITKNITMKSFITVENQTGITVQDNRIPETYSLSQNYPNPFNPSTSINFTIPKISNIKLKIFNLMGQEVYCFNKNSIPAGTYNIIWDGKNMSGNNVSSGSYFYRLETDNFIQTKKMILLK